MIIETPVRKKKRTHDTNEAKIQMSCVEWLWNEHPETRGLYFCVNNENSRSKYESKTMQLISGAQRKAMGVVAGVSDTICFIPSRGYHGLCIEFKTAIGRQSDAQKDWQQLVEEKGYKYVVIRSLDEFKKIIRWYLDEKK